MAGYSVPAPVSVITASAPQQAFVELVTGIYFSVLGVKAARAWTFSDALTDRAGLDKIAG